MALELRINSPVEQPALTDLPTLQVIDNEDYKSYWCCNSIAKRNFWKMSAASLTTLAGGLLAGFYPKISGIIAGSSLSALGNLFSTIFDLETREGEEAKRQLVEVRKQLATVVEQYTLLERNFSQLQAGVQEQTALIEKIAKERLELMEKIAQMSVLHDKTE